MAGPSSARPAPFVIRRGAGAAGIVASLRFRRQTKKRTAAIGTRGEQYSEFGVNTQTLPTQLLWRMNFDSETIRPSCIRGDEIIPTIFMM
jgi:hypothetical protein